MLKQLLTTEAKTQPAGLDSLNYLSTGLSTGFPGAQPLLPLQVTDVWQRYRLSCSTDKELLQGLAKQVAELNVPRLLMMSKFRMATQLSYAPCATKPETADAIEAFMRWADDNGITVVDGSAA